MSSGSEDRGESLARASQARAGRDADAGALVICLGVAIFALPCVVLFVLWRTGVVTDNWTGYLLWPVFFVSLFVVGEGRRMRAAAGERVLAEDVRAPIVYLRPFDADDVQNKTAWSSRVRMSPWDFYITHEQRLARTLRRAGPFVAVGDPTETLPLLGAARVYASDEEWQATIAELTARAGAVVLEAGESEGLAWEVQHVVALDAPERVILSLPEQGRRKGRSRRKRYEAFRRRFGEVFPRGLPASIGPYQFAYFDADWTPRLLGARGTAAPAGDGPRDVALRRLSREFKITWGPRWARMTAYVAAIGGVVDAITYLS